MNVYKSYTCCGTARASHRRRNLVENFRRGHRCGLRRRIRLSHFNELPQRVYYPSDQTKTKPRLLKRRSCKHCGGFSVVFGYISRRVG